MLCYSARVGSLLVHTCINCRVVLHVLLYNET